MSMHALKIDGRMEVQFKAQNKVTRMSYFCILFFPRVIQKLNLQKFVEFARRYLQQYTTLRNQTLHFY